MTAYHEDYGERSMGRSGEEADDPVAIRADIERTRERMGRTVDELGRRLNPDRLKTRMKQNLHDATVGKAEIMARNAVYRADETRHTITDTLRDNPIPAAMVGIGLGWLMVNARRDNERDLPRGMRGGRRVEVGYSTIDSSEDWDDLEAQRYRAGIELENERSDGRGRVSEMRDTAREEIREVSDRARQEVHRARDRVTEIAHDARDTVREIGDRAHSRVDQSRERIRTMGSDLAQRSRSGAGRVEHRFDDTLRDSPLAIGAAAVALGMAVGLSVPVTDREAEVLGPRRDQLLDRAREEAEELKSRARHVAERVVDETRNTVREVAREEGISGDDTRSFGGGIDTPTGI